jgi:hypothetical protein
MIQAEANTVEKKKSSSSGKISFLSLQTFTGLNPF